MAIYNLYDLDYQKGIIKKIKQTKFVIFFLLFSLFTFAVISIVLSGEKQYQWVLYLNIPLDVIGILLLLVLIQVFLPTYKFEYQMGLRSTTVQNKTITGKVIEIGTLTTTYDNQRMMSLMILVDGKHSEIFIRPWFIMEPIQSGKVFKFSLISRIVVGFQEVFES